MLFSEKQEMDDIADQVVDKLKNAASVVLTMHRAQAKSENLKLLVLDERIPKVEYQMTLTSGQVLDLINIRKKMGLGDLSSSPQSLPTVIERLMEHWRTS